MKELHVDENGLKSVILATYHNKQLKTESSSSNSIRVILPSSSNDSCQETSVDAKSSELSKPCGIDTSTCSNLTCSLEEPAVKNSLLCMAVQIHVGFSPEKQGHMRDPSKIVDNAGARDCHKLVEMIADGNSMFLEKGDLQKSISPKKENAEFAEVKPWNELNQRVVSDVEQEVGMYNEASGSCSAIQDRCGEIVHPSSVDSSVSNKWSLTETGSKIQSGYKRDRYDRFGSTNGEVSLEMSTRNEELCIEVKEPSQYRDDVKKHKTNDCMHGQGSSPFITESEDITANDQPTGVSGIDLNETILANEVDYQKQSINEVISLHAEIVSKPIPMVAKSGMPICLPKLHIQLDGNAAGWRGSAATSAFRPASVLESTKRIKASSPLDSNNGSKSSQVNWIDLNVSAEGGDSETELLPEKCLRAVSSFPSEDCSMEVSSSQAEKFKVDLNCVSENDENSHQRCAPASLSRGSVKNFDLNDDPTSADICSDSYPLALGTSALRDEVFGDSVVTFQGNAKQQKFNAVESSHRGNLSTMQRFNHGEGKPFLMTASTILPSVEQMQTAISQQQRPTYASYPPPSSFPHTLLCNNAFFIDPNNRISSNDYPPGAISYNIINPQVTAFFPGIFGSNALSAFSGTPHLMQGHVRPCFNDIAIMRPNFGPNGGITSSETGSWGVNGRQLSIPINNATTEDQMRSFQQHALSDAPMKMEPMGGWESYQPGFRPMTSWR
ncbi:hypothetical protein GH714_016911 [Hevea brasiliensis]|uniref:Uncharacterized protein n=1 Tax=Hevea brasiliensis TaxID=3981 RepID=A0A6A6KQZ2_HEVBR|nr:hypothetical protein GH714_016911 [Hevea brasiliensis]